jgi:sugar phosphate isomerase/epimerase
MPRTAVSFAVVASALSSDPREAPRVARSAGFAGLLVDAYSSAVNLPELTASGRREFRHVLASQGQQLVGLRFDFGPRGLRPGADIDRAVARLDHVMESAAGLGAPLVCAELGPLPQPPVEARPPTPKVTPERAGLILLPEGLSGPAPTPNAPAAPPGDLTFASQVDAALADLGRRADRYGVTVAFRTDLAGFAALERALRAAACPSFGVDLDPVAVLRDEWGVDEILSRLGNLVRHVRGRDAVAGTGGRARPAVVGAGSTDWGELLADLDAAGYGGWLTLDPVELTDRVAAAEAGLRHVRGFSETPRV